VRCLRLVKEGTHNQKGFKKSKLKSNGESVEGSSSGLLLRVIKSTEGDVDREKKKSADLEFYFVLVIREEIVFVYICACVDFICNGCTCDNFINLICNGRRTFDIFIIFISADDIFI